MKGNGSVRVLTKYLLIQTPMLLLVIVGLFLAQRWLDLPAWVVWGGSVVWLAKDILLFPLVRRSYDDRSQKTAHSLSGVQGRAIRMIDNSGYVFVRGSLWWAEVVGDRRPIHKGDRVRVRGSRGLVLLIEPDHLEDISGKGEEDGSGAAQAAPRRNRLVEEKKGME